MDDRGNGIIVNNLEIMGFTYDANTQVFTREGSVNQNNVEFAFEYPTCKLGNGYIDIIQEIADVETDPLFLEYVKILVDILAEKNGNIITANDTQVDALRVSVQNLHSMGFKESTQSKTESPYTKIFSLVYRLPYSHGKEVWIMLNFQETGHAYTGGLGHNGKHYVFVDVAIITNTRTISMPVKLNCQPYFWNCVWHICEMLAKPEPEPEPEPGPNGHATWP